MGSPQGKVVQGDGEKAGAASLSVPFQCLMGPALHLPVLPLAQQQIAVPKAPEGVEERVLRLPLLLHLLGLAEGGFGLRQAARLVQGIGQGRPHAHALSCSGAAVGQVHGLLSELQGLGQVAAGQVELAEVARFHRSVIPNLPGDS